MTLKASSFEEAVEMAKHGRDSMVKCPAHDDGSASLHVSPGEAQPILLKCFAGCEFQDIIAASGMAVAEVMAEPADEWKTRCVVPAEAPIRTGAGNATHVYEYCDEEGRVLFEVLRIQMEGGRKQFRQRHLDPATGQWVWNMTDVRRVLYRLPEILLAKQAGWPIWFVEGEKDVESLLAKFDKHDVKATATTAPMGANKKWEDSYTEALLGAKVNIIADADEPGRKHARNVKDLLVQAGCDDVTIYEPMQGAKDVTNHFERGGTLATLLVTSPSVVTKRETYGIDILKLVERETKAAEFVIPNLLAKGDRFLLTAFEGHGKSEMLRMIATMTAAGIHPWTHDQYEPRKVLYIDAENGPDQTLESWRNLVGLAAKHKRPVAPGMLTVLEEYDSELDLLGQEGFAWMMERMYAYMPDLVCMGPLYNMAGRDLKDDEVVRKIKHVVNSARAISGAAFIMEHHAPHKGPNDTKRTVRPYGSSMFLKWPDFGYGLQPEDKENHYKWERLRFPRVRGRSWPEYVRNGNPNTMEWPWMPCVKVEQAGGRVDYI